MSPSVQHAHCPGCAGVGARARGHSRCVCEDGATHLCVLSGAHLKIHVVTVGEINITLYSLCRN